MSTMSHFETTATWFKGGCVIAVIIFLAGFVGELDYQEAVRLEAQRHERAANLAAGLCLPRRDQQTHWYWQGEGDAARLHCRVTENHGTGRAPVTVMTASPAGLDKLALFRGEQP